MSLCLRRRHVSPAWTHLSSLLLYPDLREEKNQETGLLCFVPSDLPLLGKQVLERWLTFSLPAFAQAVLPTWTVLQHEYPWP